MVSVLLRLWCLWLWIYELVAHTIIISTFRYNLSLCFGLKIVRRTHLFEYGNANEKSEDYYYYYRRCVHLLIRNKIFV